MLLIEDSPTDAQLFREAIAAVRIPVNLHHVCDGGDALRFVRRQNPYDDVPRPDVVVLDLNLPVKSGREVLEEMAADPDLRTIPIAVLTGSASDMRVCEIYPPSRCAYFVKSGDLEQLQEIGRMIANHAKTQANLIRGSEN